MLSWKYFSIACVYKLNDSNEQNQEESYAMLAHVSVDQGFTQTCIMLAVVIVDLILIDINNLTFAHTALMDSGV